MLAIVLLPAALVGAFVRMVVSIRHGRVCSG
jgi:hypothetical protein